MANRSTGKGRQASSHEIALGAAELGREKKGEDILVLDLRKFSIGCDYFVIMTGTSEPHVRALSEWVEEELARRLNARPWHREGTQNARWILLDYVDCVVHVFHAETRQFYLLERLWGDAPKQPFGGQPRETGAEDEGEDPPGGDREGD